jgi:dimethylargininase
MTKRPPISRRLFASAAAALLVAFVAWFASTLAFFVANNAATAQLGTIASYFLLPGILFAILYFVAAAIETLVTWPRIIFASVVTAIFGAYLGSFVYSLLLGNTVPDSSVSAQVSLVGFDLVFMIFGVLASLTLGRRTYLATLAREQSTPELHRIALVRPPAATLAKGQVTHLTRKPVTLSVAEEQWEAYVTALENEGFQTLEIEQSDEHPDSVFIEDTVVMLGAVAVLGSPGAQTREGEPDAVAAALRELDFETRQIRQPGTLDGGDVLKIGQTIYVGRGGRTNAEGIRQFRAIAGELGFTVIAVPVTKALHLKSAVTALPDGTVIGHASLVDNPAIFDRYLEVPEVEGVAVVVLSPSAVLMSSSAPKTMAMIEGLGYRVVAVDIGEFEKLEGCVTCLSVRIR